MVTAAAIGWRRESPMSPNATLGHPSEAYAERHELHQRVVQDGVGRQRTRGNEVGRGHDGQ